MKITILLTIIICLFTSCHEDLFTDNKDEKVNRCEPFEDYTVPVKEGYTTYVMYAGDTLAVANEPITIKIPKNATATAATVILKSISGSSKIMTLTVNTGRQLCSRIRNRWITTITT